MRRCCRRSRRATRIITAAGIYGTVKRVEENIVVVEIAKGVTMKIARRAVAEIIRDRAEARAAAPEAPAGSRQERSRRDRSR